MRQPIRLPVFSAGANCLDVKAVSSAAIQPSFHFAFAVDSELPAIDSLFS